MAIPAKERVDRGASQWVAKQAESLPITAAAAEALTNEAGVRKYMKAVVRFREKQCLCTLLEVNRRGARSSSASATPIRQADGIATYLSRTAT
jgi:hypothetical protein